MGREFNLILCAIQFLTRIPVPAPQGFEPDWIARSAKYFPLVGALVGALAAGILLLAAQVWSGWIPALLSTAFSVFITGAFHEDGLADTADGLGGGQDKEKRLLIMKDSRLGTYGAVTLMLCLALKISALATLSASMAALCLIAGHTVSRVAAVIVMCALPYAGNADAAKVKPTPIGVRWGECAFATLFGVAAFMLVPPQPAFYGVCLGVVFAGFVALSARKLIGGQTGDVLGGVQQVFEVGFLLGVSALALTASARTI
jgi:adenosylcobinamide-GDP ribazoletransferase